MQITPTTAAVKKVFDFSRYSANGSLVLVGPIATGEVVKLERPLVADPTESNDDHWTQIVYKTDPQQLDEDTTALPCPYRIRLRVNKPATAGALGVSNT